MGILELFKPWELCVSFCVLAFAIRWAWVLASCYQDRLDDRAALNFSTSKFYRPKSWRSKGKKHAVKYYHQ